HRPGASSEYRNPANNPGETPGVIGPVSTTPPDTDVAHSGTWGGSILGMGASVSTSLADETLELEVVVSLLPVGRGASVVAPGSRSCNDRGSGSLPVGGLDSAAAFGSTVRAAVNAMASMSSEHTGPSKLRGVLRPSSVIVVNSARYPAPCLLTRTRKPKVPGFASTA